MNSSIAFRTCIAVVLFLTVGWKIAIHPDDQNYLTEDLRTFLERNHFNVALTDKATNSPTIIRATTSSCHLQIARLDPDGSNQNLARVAAGTDRFFVVFRGTVYRQQPVLWTVLYYAWSRFLRELGLIRHITPVIAVAVTPPSCDAERLPWDELQGVR